MRGDRRAFAGFGNKIDRIRGGSAHQPARRIRAAVARGLVIVRAPDQPIGSHADPNILFGQEIAGRQSPAAFGACFQAHDLGAAAIPKGFLDPQQFSRHHAAHPLGGLQQVGQILDKRIHFLVFGLDLLAFEGGQTPQLQIEDGSGLKLTQLVALHQFGARRIHIGGRANDVDDLIQVLQRHQIAFEDMGTLSGFLQIELGAALDDCQAMLDIDAQGLLERKRARLAIHERQQVNAEGGLHRCALI